MTRVTGVGAMVLVGFVVVGVVVTAALTSSSPRDVSLYLDRATTGRRINGTPMRAIVNADPAPFVDEGDQACRWIASHPPFSLDVGGARSEYVA